MDAEAKKIKEIEECFYLNLDINLYAGQVEQGRVPNSNLLTLMRMLGTNASEDETKDIIAKIDPNNTGSFTKDAFVGLMKERITSAGTE